MSRKSEWCLIRLNGTRSIYHINFGYSLIGRNSEAFITCLSTLVSKCHLMISCVKDQPHLLIRDMSANGTYLNNELLPQNKFCHFREKDIISLGVPVNWKGDSKDINVFQLVKATDCPLIDEAVESLDSTTEIVVDECVETLNSTNEENNSKSKTSKTKNKSDNKINVSIPIENKKDYVTKHTVIANNNENDPDSVEIALEMLHSSQMDQSNTNHPTEHSKHISSEGFKQSCGDILFNTSSSGRNSIECQDINSALEVQPVSPVVNKAEENLGMSKSKHIDKSDSKNDAASTKTNNVNHSISPENSITKPSNESKCPSNSEPKTSKRISINERSTLSSNKRRSSILIDAPPLKKNKNIKKGQTTMTSMVIGESYPDKVSEKQKPLINCSQMNLRSKNMKSSNDSTKQLQSKQINISPDVPNKSKQSQRCLEKTNLNSKESQKSALHKSKNSPKNKVISSMDSTKNTKNQKSSDPKKVPTTPGSKDHKRSKSCSDKNISNKIESLSKSSRKSTQIEKAKNDIQETSVTVSQISSKIHLRSKSVDLKQVTQNKIHPNDPRIQSIAIPSTSKEFPKIAMVEPIPQTSNTNRICNRRNSILNDLYESNVVSKPVSQLLQRRKSVSFVEENPTAAKRILQRRPSAYYCRSDSIEPLASSLTTTKHEGDPYLSTVPMWLSIFLKYIIRWNTKWFEEYSKNSSLPPIYHDPTAVIPSMMYHYQDLDHYTSTISKLIVLEIWEAAFKAFPNCKQNNETMMTISAPVQKKFAESKIVRISMMCQVSTELHNIITSKSIGFGSLILIKFPSVSVCSKRWLMGLVSDFDIKLTKKRTLSVKELYMTVYIRLDSAVMDRIKMNSTTIVQFLLSLKTEITSCKALYKLDQSPLCNIITAPKVSHFKPLTNLSTLLFNDGLNLSQEKAVKECISAIHSETSRIQLIQGPPGTGKSRVIVSLVMEYLLRNPNKSQRGTILLCAQSNAAIDEVVKRLQETLPEEQQFKMVRVGRQESMQTWCLPICSTYLATQFENTPETFTQIKILRSNILKFEKGIEAGGPQGAYSKVQFDTYNSKLQELLGGPQSSSLKYAEECRVIENADIIATTLQSCGLSKLKILQNKISICIIDEAAKATEPEVLIPLSLGVTNLILVGDQQQIAGFVASQQAKRKGLSESLFTRLFHCMQSWPENPTLMLNTQYRMAPEIALFPNLAFYKGELENGAKLSPLPFDLPQYRVVYVPSHVSKAPIGQNQESGVNYQEACVVAKLACLISNLGISSRKQKPSICVLTPYCAQREIIQNEIKKLTQSCDVDVYTVDAFQGQERDIIIISLARITGLGFLTDPGRMSVMLTRARKSCIICCNPDAVKGQILWMSLLENADTRKVSRKVPVKLNSLSFLK